MNVLLTGGAGFIGSHTAVELIGAGYGVVIADNLSNSRMSALDAVERITGARPRFYRVDTADAKALSRVFDENDIGAAIHLAGLKAAEESVALPLPYYRVNIGTTLALLEAMSAHGCGRLIFSSSAAVYGTANPSPYTEDMPIGECANPYGRTKAMIERILRDACAADPKLSVVALRYFNAVGAHGSGLLGEDPVGAPRSLMPCLCRAARGEIARLEVFGTDYLTRDGTCVRDYVHVADIARGHAAALRYACAREGFDVFNLGTGRGASVLEMIATFERVNALKLPYTRAPRRPGDIASCRADVSKAERVLGWKAEKTLDDMCRDSWNWTEKSSGRTRQAPGRAGAI